MANFMQFFPRQMVMGPAGASGTIYSDIFDASAIATVNLEIRAFVAQTATTCSVQLEQNEDSSFIGSNWSDYGTAISVTGAGTGTPVSIATMPKRFIRAKLTVTGDKIAMIQCNGRGFC